jgi:hypothetical protein
MKDIENVEPYISVKCKRPNNTAQAEALTLSSDKHIYDFVWQYDSLVYCPYFRIFFFTVTVTRPSLLVLLDHIRRAGLGLQASVMPWLLQ